MSITVTLGLSSMKMGALSRRLTATPSFCQSSGSELPGPDPLAVHSGLGGEEALAELEMSHLEREQQARALRDDSHMGEDPEGEAGLADRRAGADDGEGGRLQPGEDLVEVDVAGGDAGDRVARRARAPRSGRDSGAGRRGGT